MENLRFIREDAGLTLRELAELTEISYSLLSQIESGRRSLTERNAETLSNFFAVTRDFLEDNSNFGIFCDTEKERGELLSLAEYKTQRAMGNIDINPRFRHPPYTEKEIQELEKLVSDIDKEHILLMRKKPFVVRTLKTSTPQRTPKAQSLIGELARLAANMSEEQLEKTLLIVKEVILK